MTRRLLALALAAAFCLPIGGASGTSTNEASSDGFSDDCLGTTSGFPIFRCALYQQVNLTVETCDETTCTIRVDSTAATTVGPLPGIVGLATTLYSSGGGSICLGPKVVTDQVQDVAPCDRLCQVTVIGRSATCLGTKTLALPLFPGGECQMVGVLSDVSYDPYNAFTSVAVIFDICRTETGEIAIDFHQF